jgi:hypothetical protein
VGETLECLAAEGNGKVGLGRAESGLRRRHLILKESLRALSDEKRILNCRGDEIGALDRHAVEKAVGRAADFEARVGDR